jgi:hypothetical protein
MIVILFIFLRLITVLLLSYSVYCRDSSSSRNADLLKELEPRQSQSSTFFHPKCMDNWRKSQSEQIKTYMKTFFDTVLSTMITSDNKCNTKSIIAITTDSATVLPWFLHFYSILLWQKDVFQLTEDPCARYFVIPDEVTNFWEWLRLEGSWIRGFTFKLNNLFGKPLLYSNSSFQSSSLQKSVIHTVVAMKRSDHQTVLHPSDAVLLTHNLLQKDPCLLHGQRLALLQKPLNIIIINRRDRGMLNLDQIHETTTFTTLPGKQANKQSYFSMNTVEVKFFDSLSFKSQVKLLYETDIVISIHGSALTNIIFMKPCSIVIEIFPWLFHDYRFFASLGKSADILHYYWMESPENTKRLEREKYSKHCQDFVNHFGQLQNTTQHLQDYTGDFYAHESLTSRCMRDPQCHDCMKKIHGLYVDLPKLQKVLSVALEDRRKCISEHPFYHE